MPLKRLDSRLRGNDEVVLKGGEIPDFDAFPDIRQGRRD